MSDKTGIVELAKCLASDANVTIVASGGTAKFLKDFGVQVKWVKFVILPGWSKYHIISEMLRTLVEFQKC